MLTGELELGEQGRGGESSRGQTPAHDVGGDGERHVGNDRERLPWRARFSEITLVQPNSRIVRVAAAQQGRVARILLVGMDPAGRSQQLPGQHAVAGADLEDEIVGGNARGAHDQPGDAGIDEEVLRQPFAGGRGVAAAVAGM